MSNHEGAVIVLSENGQSPVPGDPLTLTEMYHVLYTANNWMEGTGSGDNRSPKQLAEFLWSMTHGSEEPPLEFQLMVATNMTYAMEAVHHAITGGRDR